MTLSPSHITVSIIMAGLGLAFVGCSQDAPPEGSAVKNREQLPVMVTRGVSKMVSDSGVTRYKFITEEWAIFDQTKPPRQEFKKGILILRYDDKMNIDMQITADTAYWYDSKLWELRGRVRLINEAKETTFRSEQLYWDMQTHEFYSNVWMHLITPEREIEGSRFRANEQMTKYNVDDAKGRIPMPKKEKGNNPSSASASSTTSSDSTKQDKK